MATNIVSLIGREQELSWIDQRIACQGTLNVICVDGEGGIGKTRLLQELQKLHVPSAELKAIGIFDFDTPQLRVPGSVRLALAQALGKETFNPYFQQLQLWDALVQDGADDARLSQMATDIKASFDSCYHALSATKRLLILMDTLEDVQHTTIWPEIEEIITSATNTVFVLSGRKTASLAQRLSGTLPNAVVELIHLERLTSDAADAYMREKADSLNLRFEMDVRARLLAVTGGKPILLDLASEWVARAIVMDWLIELPPSALENISDEQREQFEDALVQHIHDIQTPLNQIILRLAFIYPMDKAILRTLFGDSIPNPDQQIRELGQLSFVKVLPDGSFALHDEMRRMVVKYIWEKIDSDWAYRKQVSRRMMEYFKRRAERLRSRAGAETGVVRPGPLEGFIKQNSDRYQYWSLRAQQLFYQIQRDPRRGYNLFLKLFEEAEQTHQLAFQNVLLDGILEDPTLLNEDQRYEVNLQRAITWLRAGLAPDVERAQELLEALLIEHAEKPARALDLLSRLANSAIKLGQIPVAVDLLLRAVAVADKRVPTWLDSMQNLLGYAYRLQGRLDLARETYQEALRNADDYETTASILNNLGFVECLQGEYEAGLYYCEQGLTMRKELGQRRELAMTYATLGDIYRHWGHYDEATAVADQAIAIFEEFNDRAWLARVYARRGAARRLQAKTDAERVAALADLQQSLDLDFPGELPYAAHVMGCVYWDMNQLERALEWFDKSEHYLAQRFDIWNHVNNVIARAEVSFQQWRNTHDAGEQVRYGQTIQECYDEITHFGTQNYTLSHQIGRISRLLADFYFAQGNYNLARDGYAEAYKQLSGRYAGYGKRTLRDELGALGARIDSLEPSEAIQWCDYFKGLWSELSAVIRKREALLSFCFTHRTKARLRLPKSPQVGALAAQGA